MHIEALPQQMGLMQPPSSRALKLRLGEVILQQSPVLGVRALANNDTGSLLRAQAAHISEALLGHNDVQIVLGLVDVGGHWHDAGNSVWVNFGWAGGRGVHDGVLAAAQEIGGTTDAVEHA